MNDHDDHDHDHCEPALPPGPDAILMVAEEDSYHDTNTGIECGNYSQWRRNLSAKPAAKKFEAVCFLRYRLMYRALYSLPDALYLQAIPIIELALVSFVMTASCVLLPKCCRQVLANANHRTGMRDTHDFKP